MYRSGKERPEERGGRDVRRKKAPRTRRLHIFDFDQTLFQSPGPGPDVPEDQRGEFWHDPSSLGAESVPENPNENWYIRHVVEAFRRAKKDPKAYVAVMTGRSEPLRGRVEELLKHMDLEPDELILKQKKEPTSGYKIREMKQLLKDLPRVDRVHFYEDREHHLKEFQEAAEKDGYDFVPHFVPEGDANLTWEDFMWTMYEGGARKVKNTNPKSRDRHPEVRADYLIKTDPNFASKIRRQYRAWVSMGKPRGRRKVERKTARRRLVLSLSLDLQPRTLARRVARRYLLSSPR
jgi:hypothetical protein